MSFGRYAYMCRAPLPNRAFISLKKKIRTSRLSRRPNAARLKCMTKTYTLVLCSFLLTVGCGPDGSPVENADVAEQETHQDQNVEGAELGLAQGRVRARGPFGVRVVQSCPNPGAIDFAPQLKPIDTDFFQVLVFGGQPRRYRPTGPIYKVSDTQTANVTLNGNGGINVSGYRCIVNTWCGNCP